MIQFEPQEIDLARELHHAGLGWQPEDGDPFLVERAMEAGNARLEPGAIYVFHSTWLSPADLQDHVIWLPRWDRVRAWFAARGVYQMTHYSERGKADIKVWPTRENMSPLYAGHAASSLAALYQILLQAVRDGK